MDLLAAHEDTTGLAAPHGYGGCVVVKRIMRMNGRNNMQDDTSPASSILSNGKHIAAVGSGLVIGMVIGRSVHRNLTHALFGSGKGRLLSAAKVAVVAGATHHYLTLPDK